MSADAVALRTELKALARGRGLRTADLKIGPELRRAAGLDDLPDSAVRAQLTGWLRDRLSLLPDDLRQVAAVALGLEPGADQRWLTKRFEWLAIEIDRDPRTVRRHCDDAFGLLVEALVNGGAVPAPRWPRGDGAAAHREPGAPLPSSWYVERVSAVLRLDGEAPELFEARRIVALEPDLDEVTLVMSLPRPPEAPPSPRNLGVDVVFGARATQVTRRGETQFSLSLRLPRPLGVDERHTFACVWQVPIGQPIAPHYALSPTIRCDELAVRVRFPDGANSTVQRVDGLPLRTVEDYHVDLPEIPLDGVSEAEARFTGLSLGLCYGLRWR